MMTTPWRLTQHAPDDNEEICLPRVMRGLSRTRVGRCRLHELFEKRGTYHVAHARIRRGAARLRLRHGDDSGIVFVSPGDTGVAGVATVLPAQ